MTSPPLAQDVPTGTYHVVAGGDVVPLAAYPRAGLSPGLECLIEQEVCGRRDESVPARLAQLLTAFGFGWEPLSEAGHMRFLGPAAFMLAEAAGHAARVADAICAGLGMPCQHLDGVTLVDPATPVMRRYLELTSREAGLYGDSPYQVSGAGRGYLLRQTACFQKFAACLEQPLAAGTLPAALFEISDSFRREPEDALQLGCRLRRFHLPETHVHTPTVDEAAAVSGHLHDAILAGLRELGADLVLLISATHDFAQAHRGYLTALAAQADCVALLKESRPGQTCEDGVEVDVEYKVVDSGGCCRELSTFQIDELITRSFGVRCADGSAPATIHSVFTGSLERYLFFTLDRVVRAEAGGRRCHLPLWISPVVARVVPADTAAVPPALAAGARLSGAGIRVDLDDRGHPVDAAVVGADALLVPYLVLVAADGAVRVRDYESGQFRDCTLDTLAAEIGRRRPPPTPVAVQRLSRQPFQTTGVTAGS